MSTSTPPTLGTVIGNPTARKIIYGAYVIALVISGAIQVAYASIPADQPTWLGVALSVLGYLGIPIGSLALVNATSTDLRTPRERNADRQAKLAREGQAPE